MYTESQSFIIKEEITMGVKISRDFTLISAFSPCKNGILTLKSLEILSPLSLVGTLPMTV